MKRYVIDWLFTSRFCYAALRIAIGQESEGILLITFAINCQRIVPMANLPRLQLSRTVTVAKYVHCYFCIHL